MLSSLSLTTKKTHYHSLRIFHQYFGYSWASLFAVLNTSYLWSYLRLASLLHIWPGKHLSQTFSFPRSLLAKKITELCFRCSRLIWDWATFLFHKKGIPHCQVLTAQNSRILSTFLFLTPKPKSTLVLIYSALH